MGTNLATTIASPQIVAVGGVITGTLTITPPAAGNFYLLAEQYSVVPAAIPGSQSYLHQPVVSGDYENDTSLYTTFRPTSIAELPAITANITVPNTNCLLYVFLKQRAATILATALVAGVTYEIISLGTTDYTLVGAVANTVGVKFTATGVALGTGTANEVPDPDNDTTIDSVVVTLQAPGIIPEPSSDIDMSAMMNLMITMMIVVMMMKMMTGAMEKS